MARMILSVVHFKPSRITVEKKDKTQKGKINVLISWDGHEEKNLGTNGDN